jgi:hypothetical protein
MTSTPGHRILFGCKKGNRVERSQLSYLETLVKRSFILYLSAYGIWQSYTR